LASSDGCGITLLRDESGSKLLLAIDYSRHDESEINLEREYTVTLNTDYSDATCLDGKKMRRLKNGNGMLDAITVTLRQHESALIKLIRR